MDIFVNNDCLRYELLVNTCFTQVSVWPRVIDFGEIDVCMVSEVKKITITNSGTKQATYSTDLGRNPLQIIVKPMKGTVQPGESKQIAVEVFGTCEGEFNQEFWIKTEPLQRVHIQGHFIEPGLKVDYPLANRNILVLTFPKTFVGVQQDRNVVIKNYSSTSTVFCVIGITRDDEHLPFNDLSGKDINFKQFAIHPVEGRLHKDQKYIMTITYSPQKAENKPNFHICRVIVAVMKCRADGNPCRVQRRLLYESGSAAQGAYVSDSVSVSSIVTNATDKPQEITLIPNDSVNILLYGEVELPKVSIRPEKFYLKDLKVYETHEEILEIFNNSKTLPLVMKYKKAPSVELEPKTIYLPPREPVEVSLKVRPTKMGDALAKVKLEVFFQQGNNLVKVKTIHFDIVYSGDYTEDRMMLRRKKPYFLPGITPVNHNEVGYLVDDVKFSSKIDKPNVAMLDAAHLDCNKHNDALIAFPNDKPRVLKPWRNTVP
ncbi:uncharacterized protein LOC109538722 [Dendroctonus ponderosae]|uniref:uncharacterized protein LOC109538722 n=1 Tax=Dendroctonus ponderosae TaxID=77166 RepID=UPI002034D3FB|nr:uncharacterized protein LOC109538722 [Dendroctonus ponderosae]